MDDADPGFPQSGSTPVPPGLGRDELHEILAALLLTRAVEERLQQLVEEDGLEAEVRRSLGQEGGAVGAAYSLRRRTDGKGDLIAPSRRGIGALLVMGIPPIDCFRQHLGRGTAPDGGRAGDLSWFDGDRGVLGPAGPAGTNVQVMAGMTLALRMRSEDRVGMVFAGDGASSTGGWHEGLNFAAVRRCPMVLVVEANKWAFSTPTRRQTRNRTFLERCPAYGIEGVSVDGMDVLEVVEQSCGAVERARAGKGVQMVEVRSYRVAGHTVADDQEYVDSAELEEWRSRDPVEILVRRLRDRRWITRDQVEELRRDAGRRAAAAADEALAEASPPAASVLEGVREGAGSGEPWWKSGLLPGGAR